MKKNWRGKEYSLDMNALLIEGEYLNDKRNGNGKEYKRKGELIFEGEYLNGKGMEKHIIKRVLLNLKLKMEKVILNKITSLMI